MKYIFSILFFIPILALGQTSFGNKIKSNGYEIGLNLYSYTPRHYYETYTSNSSKYKSNFIPGIVIKKYFNKNALSLSINYGYRNINILDSGHYHFYKDNGKVNSIDLKLGYERVLIQKRIEPYVFGDLNFYYSKSNGTFTSYGCFTQIYDKKYEDKNREYSFHLGTGLRFHISKKIVFFYEFSYQIGIAYSNDPIESEYNLKNHRRFKGINPIQSCGFNYCL